MQIRNGNQIILDVQYPTLRYVSLTLTLQKQTYKFHRLSDPFLLPFTFFPQFEGKGMTEILRKSIFTRHAISLILNISIMERYIFKAVSLARSRASARLIYWLIFHWGLNLSHSFLFLMGTLSCNLYWACVSDVDRKL